MSNRDPLNHSQHHWYVCRSNNNTSKKGSLEIHSFKFGRVKFNRPVIFSNLIKSISGHIDVIIIVVIITVSVIYNNNVKFRSKVSDRSKASLNHILFLNLE